MKFGAHIFLWTDRWSDASLSLLDRAASLGLNALAALSNDCVAASRAIRDAALGDKSASVGRPPSRS